MRIQFSDVRSVSVVDISVYIYVRLSSLTKLITLLETLFESLSFVCLNRIERCRAATGSWSDLCLMLGRTDMIHQHRFFAQARNQCIVTVYQTQLMLQSESPRKCTHTTISHMEVHHRCTESQCKPETATRSQHNREPTALRRRTQW